MPRDLPVGNGNMLVAFDNTYRLREFYYPYVGQVNHTLGHPFRFGVWADGILSWIEEASWERELVYEPDTLVTCVTLTNPVLGLKLICRDCVDFEMNLYLRRIDVENLVGGKRDVRIFFHHDFHIGGSTDGDTAFYHPGERAVMHYKGQHWFIASAMTMRVWGVSSYATGVKRHHGAAGTWCDADDGVLGRNAIAQGSVDSTVSVHLTVETTATMYYWVGAGQDLTEVLRINEHVRELEPENILRRVRAYWRQWVSHDRSHPKLPEEIQSAYRRSLLILRTQIDNRGAILAANDSDTLEYNRDSYSYLWPRDGALVAHALDLAGYHDVSQRFFAFCSKLISPSGYFMHKYNPDGSIGSSWHPWIGESGALQLPIQEDETALTVYALWEHYERCRDIDFVRTVYGPLIEKAADFMCSFRDSHTLLPDESWDLWEERRGIHLFTVASTWAGLMAASRFASIFGDGVRSERCRKAAEEIKEATEQFLYHEGEGRYLRGLVRQDRELKPDMVLDCSQAGVFLFGMFDADAPRVIGTMQAIEQRLACRTHVGGIARYERDPYYQMTHDTDCVPGNPWFLCTLWVAQWHIATAQKSEDLDRPLALLEWTARHAHPSGVLAEQLHPYTGAPLSVSPLTWSHATFVSTVCRWEEQYRRLTDRRRTGAQ